MKLFRSILAICMALCAALAVQWMLSAVFKLAAPAIDGLSGRALTGALITAYLLGAILTAIAGGVALGRLAPTKPSLHVAAVALLSPLIGYLLIGLIALPHGWQIVGYGAQLILIEFVTLRAFRSRAHPPTRFLPRPA